MLQFFLAEQGAIQSSVYFMEHHKTCLQEDISTCIGNLDENKSLLKN